MKAQSCFSVFVATTLACACGGSCSGGTTAPTGGVPVDAGNDEGGDADAPPDIDDAPADVKDAAEEPWGEAGWTPVAWDAPCSVDVAANPAAAVPPLIWESCENNDPGCEQARVAWDKPFGEPFAPLNIIRTGGGYRVGATLFYKDNELRSVIYDESGFPIAGWRSSECVIVVPMPTPNRAWMGAQAAKSRWIVEPYENLAKATTAIDLKIQCQDYAASDDVLGLWGVGGNTAIIYDRLNGMTKVLGPDPDLGFYQPFPVNGGAFMRHFPEFNRAEGWAWNRATSTAAPLIQPGGSISVADIKSDGTTLVWVEGGLPLTPQGVYAWANLWTSPSVTDKNELVATKRRALPALGEINSSAGDGYYSLYGGLDKMVHVYRLADARHWSFKPPESSLNLHEVSYVDKDYVFYQTFANVYRQSMASLGPGDPPP